MNKDFKYYTDSKPSYDLIIIALEEKRNIFNIYDLRNINDRHRHIFSNNNYDMWRDITLPYIASENYYKDMMIYHQGSKVMDRYSFIENCYEKNGTAFKYYLKLLREEKLKRILDSN